jgi:FkbM family methyltransferase
LRRLGIEVRLRPPISREVALADADESMETLQPDIERRWVEVRAGPAKGARLYLNVETQIDTSWMEGSYDSFIYDALETTGIDLLGATAWDVGAHCGYHTVALASLVGPSGQVVAFEPNPQNIRDLRRNLENNPLLAERVRLRTEALSNCDGEHIFRHSPRFPSRGFLDINGPPSDRFPRTEYEAYDTMSVAVVRADSILRAGLRPPNMIKIDVEGAEVAVLEGAQELLRNHSPLLVIEVHNITCMFLTQRILYEAGYNLRLLDSGQRSSSRSFLFASPEA